MKINIILILILSVMIYNLKSEEFETMDIEWKKLELSVLENNTHRALVTYKDEIIFEPQLQISKDKGKTTRKFPYMPFPEDMPDYFEEFHVNNILGYAYDSQNGLYLIDFIDKTTSDPNQGKIYYIPADKDTLYNLISFDIPDVPEQTNYIYSTFISLDNSIIISNRRQIWIYDISQKKINTVKFVDSLNNELNNQVISEFSIRFCYYKKEQSRLDIVYTINNYIKYKYSDDGGKTFVDGVYNANCFNRGSLNNSMYLWNGNDSWYGDGTSNEGNNV